MPVHRDLAVHQLVQGGRGDVDVAHGAPPARLPSGALSLRACRLTSTSSVSPFLRDARTARLHIQRQGLVARRPRAGAGWPRLGAAQKLHLVRQADADQRAARALGAVVERRRQSVRRPRSRRRPSTALRVVRAQLFVEDHAYALADSDEVEHALVAASRAPPGSCPARRAARAPDRRRPRRRAGACRACSPPA